MDSQVVLEVRGLTKSFGPIHALADVDFSLRKGEIHALAGENGAGKSTLMNLISGVLRPTSGEIRIDGEIAHFASPAEAQARGVWLVHQEISLCPDISVAENIMMAATGASRRLFVDFRGIRDKADKAIRQLAPLPVDTLVGRLSISDQQIVEIAKALVLDCRILILDEPTAALTEREVRALFRVMRDLRVRGISILYVSHRMAEIFEICDRVSVFRDGKYIATEAVADTTPERVGALMVGRMLGDLYPPKAAPGDIAAPVLEVARLSGDRFRNVAFAARKGEILGIGGLIGAGRSEILKAVCGLYPREQGEIRLNGAVLKINAYRDAVEAGVVYLSEDRKSEGLFLEMSIARNMSSLDLDAVATAYGFVSKPREDAQAHRLRSIVALKTDRISLRAAALSGGNQQKVAIAQLLAIRPKVVLLDEPTRGVDIGAKSEIHKLLRDLTRQGVCVVVISSELPELIGLCDRILVVRQGGIAGEVSGDGATEENIIALASGLSEARRKPTQTLHRGA